MVNLSDLPVELIVLIFTYSDFHYLMRMKLTNSYIKSIISVHLEYIFKNYNSIDLNEIFQHACKYGHVKIVELLLDHPKIDLTTGYYLPLRLSSKYGHTKIVKLLFNHPNVNPTVWGNNPIRLASQNGHTGVVELLLKDPRMNLTNEEKNKAIILASQNGHIEVVELLSNH
jgi:ankyrin repeat protein